MTLKFCVSNDMHFVHVKYIPYQITHFTKELDAIV